MPRSPHAVAAFLAWLALFLAYDLLLYFRVVPSPTLTEEVRAFAARHPLAWDLLYLSACSLLYLHFRPDIPFRH